MKNPESCARWLMAWVPRKSISSIGLVHRGDRWEGGAIGTGGGSGRGCNGAGGAVGGGREDQARAAARERRLGRRRRDVSGKSQRSGGDSAPCWFTASRRVLHRKTRAPTQPPRRSPGLLSAPCMASRSGSAPSTAAPRHRRVGSLAQAQCWAPGLTRGGTEADGSGAALDLARGAVHRNPAHWRSHRARARRRSWFRPAPERWRALGAPALRTQPKRTTPQTQSSLGASEPPTAARAEAPIGGTSSRSW